jgi:hypothetical protein
MTSCAECLTAMSTLRLSELTGNAAVTAHTATCERCAEVASSIRFAEQRLAVTLADARPTRFSEEIADEAIVGAEKLRRRTAARWFRGALGALACAIAGTYLWENVWPGPKPDVVTETLVLRCATPEDASQIASPYLRSDGAAIITARAAHTLTLRGARPEIMQAMAQVDALDARVCSIAPTPP